MNPPEEYADGGQNVVYNNEEIQAMMGPSHPQDDGDMDVTELKQLSFHLSLLEMLPSE